MLSYSDFLIVVCVAESTGCIKQALLKWTWKSQQLRSVRITQKKWNSHATKEKN